MELRIAEIMRILPHRYPFLLIDRVIEVDPDKRIVALKNVTINEPFFAGHFPATPVMPGVLTIESMAQAGAVLGLLEKDADLSKTLVYFMGIDEARFRRPIVPGRRTPGGSSRWRPVVYTDYACIVQSDDDRRANL